MSLISDALKKARQEAARQDSLRQGVPYAMGAVEAPARSPLITLLAGLGVGCVLAATFFAFAFFAGWGPFHKGAPPVPEARMAAAPAAQSAPAVAPSAPILAPIKAPTPTVIATDPAVPAPQAMPPVRPAPVARPPETPALPAPRPTPTAAAPSPLPVEAVPDPTPNTATVPPAPLPQAPAPQPAPPAVPAAPAGGLEEGKVYTGEVPIPGGGQVKLNGIAFSQDHPVAVLDGRVMGPGESVGGFTIVAIESGRVKLQGHGATVYLAPR
jgi:hypothetical protein